MCGFLSVNNETVYVQNFYRTISDDAGCYKSNDRIDVNNLVINITMPLLYPSKHLTLLLLPLAHDLPAENDFLFLFHKVITQKKKCLVLHRLTRKFDTSCFARRSVEDGAYGN